MSVVELHEPKLYSITVDVTMRYTLYEEARTEGEVARIVGECIADGSLSQYAAHTHPAAYNITAIRCITKQSDIATQEEPDE